jgi:hypothetical protein
VCPSRAPARMPHLPFSALGAFLRKDLHVIGAQPLPEGRVKETVVAHYSSGLDVLLDDQVAVAVDLRFIDADVLIWDDPCRWPGPGTRYQD